TGAAADQAREAVVVGAAGVFLPLQDDLIEVARRGGETRSGLVDSISAKRPIRIRPSESREVGCSSRALARGWGDDYDDNQ
ncbi:MAG TPA: hypothetical protein VG963_30455, partial [Polyangiaceae bacterium]|nr:hypothetical protein [Polyangiaceae bacterium]